MLSYRYLKFLLLFTFVFFSSTSLAFSPGVRRSLTNQTPSDPGKVDEGKNGVFVYKRNIRLLFEESEGEAPLNSSLILAAKRTHRRDPLDHFRKYSGGWNISARHYWASVAFTGAPFFVIATVWLISFGLCLSLICLCYFCCARDPYGYSRIAYALSLILLVLFTVAAIVGCVVLYTGQGKYHGSTTRTLRYIVNTSDTTVEKLRNVSAYLDAAKRIGVAQVFLPSNVLGDIDRIQTRINSSANTLETRTENNSHNIHHVLNSVRLALIVLSAVMLLLTFLGFLFSLQGMKFLVYMLVVAGWIFVTMTFILCGIFLVLHNVTADTCVSMDQWDRNPTAHTALDDILPCVDNITAQETLLNSKEVTYQLANVINQVITNVTNRNLPPNIGPLYFNQSGPLMPILCNPFNSDMSDRPCAAGEVNFTNATQVWSNYVCQVSSAGICTTPGRLTPTFSDQMSAGVNVSFGLYHYGPFLVSLQDCTFVRQTFGVIYSEYCPALRKYSKWIYVGLVMVSMAVMLSLLFWVIYGRERRHRVYTKMHMSQHGRLQTFLRP